MKILASFSLVLLADLLLIPMLPLRAQPVGIGRPALQAVGLFQHVCLPYAGLAGNLRAFAASKGLHQIPDSHATAFLLGHPGEVFNASTPDGQLALVSMDDGACVVAMPMGDRVGVNNALAGVFRTIQAVVTLVSDKASPDGKATQRLELVRLGNSAWHVSVTTHAHPEAPTAPPTLIIMATSTP